MPKKEAAPPRAGAWRSRHDRTEPARRVVPRRNGALGFGPGG